MAKYADIAFANAYFADRLHTEPWDDAPIGDRNAALSMGTRSFDNLDFAGCKADSSQDNEFPRAGQLDVPDSVKQANCEEALALLDGIDPAEELLAARVTSDGYSSARATYSQAPSAEHVYALIASASAWALLKQYLREDTNIRISRVS